MRKLEAAALAVLLSISFSAGAATVASTRPYPGTSDWTDVVGPGTSMVEGSGQTVLSTADYASVWFGHSTNHGNTPSWSIGSPGTGNALSLSVSFSAGAADWWAYLYDGEYAALMTFNPTSCNPAISCYGIPGDPGVQLWHGDWASSFVDLDTTSEHQYAFTLINGTVRYTVDGDVMYEGAAIAAGDDPLLLIGDETTSAPSGQGEMIVYAVAFDNNPSAVAPVPEPETWALMLTGLGALGALARKRRQPAA